MSKRIMGPILGCTGLSGGRWGVRAIAATKATKKAPLLECAGQQIEGELLKKVGNEQLWSFTWNVEQSDAEQSHTYTLFEESFTFRVPGRHSETRLGYLYGGVDLFAQPGRAVFAQRCIAAQKQQSHLLLLGGAQLRLDPWQEVAILKRWLAKPEEARQRAKASNRIRAALEEYYWQQYCQFFNQPALRELLATVPALMVGDEHDHFRRPSGVGEGSVAAPVYQTLREVARESFRHFQTLSSGSEVHFHRVLALGSTALVALDLFSEQQRTQALSPASWEWLMHSVKKLSDVNVLIFLSPTPLIFTNTHALEKNMRWMPSSGLIEEAHLRWSGDERERQREIILQDLLDWQDRPEKKVVILSGDVHVAALGKICHEKGVGSGLHQLISSTMSNTPLNDVMLFYLNHVASTEQLLAPGIKGEMLAFPTKDRCFLNTASWLNLQVKGQEVASHWYIEGEEEQPCTYRLRPVREKALDKVD